MASYLKDIQNSVIKYANIISEILHVEVEIVDENLDRIAGTGIFQNRINENMANVGYVYKNVLKSGETQIIYKPGKDELCIPCPNRDTCEEKFEMSTPIKLNNETIGVIGLVCVTNEQRKYLMDRFHIHVAFLKQISEFISISAYEKKEKMRNQILIELFNTIIDKVDQGVIILNKENYIIHINKNALKYLNIHDNSFKQKISIKFNRSSILNLEEYKLTIGNESFNLLGNIYPVYLNEDQYDKMFFFHDIKEFKEKINKLSIQEKRIFCDDILGNCKKMQKLKKTIKKIASSTSTVLVSGESGTGKELVARAIHNESNRREEPFIAINCAAIPDSLLESELFGYVKGAFTGADPMGKMGKFELANKGTIFLDEIGDMPLSLQTKLLRVLQERKVIRIGSNKQVNIDVRVIAATNKNLIDLIEEDKFREDLYYRLNVIPIEIPPLRERIEDIKLLTDFFIKKYLSLFNKDFMKIKIDKQVWDVFYLYQWPGNIRELENTIEFMINMVGIDGILSESIIPKSISERKVKIKDENKEICTLKELEKRAIEKALETYGKTTEGKKIASAKLGIGIATLYRKIEEYNLSK
ncbi:sigma-54 interaction domain-containing protein [Clostridium tetanomorphum]|uniref:Sigma 54-interacting transcriptional regulator n=1 Tax=Clostridium tetanomorphum TaxID=1553 RepID=A0A923J260_CLOTT|nr:sigma 54-interacting transcriptional regulator [Clostridium tetanomorphum]MBC2399941.1 sigma 54-interacting transcriptional regulator [Clostridium tetanomorphum]NRZ95336.1 transcriptional regulator with PAS, ATPase and Fis domain [Clostridium tetanomorphum]